MGFMLDKLRERLRKKQEKANAVKNFKKIPRKDISFLSSESTPNDITTFVNNRMIQLITQVGGDDKFVDGDFTVEYVDRTTAKEYTQKHEYLTEANLSKDNNYSQSDEFDWETKQVDVSTDIVEGTNIQSMQFYMVIIEYTEIKEVN